MNWLDFFKIFKNTSHKKPKRPFSVWQIELTSRCPLRCKMCPRKDTEDRRGTDMSLVDFKRLTPYFKYVEAIILEGWGESLLHKGLTEAIRLIKEEGSEVGFVTSGKGLNKEYASELINAGVDFIGFSLSGATSKTHNSIKVNSDFHTLLDDIKVFVDIKADEKLKKPKLHIVYLMLKDNISEIPALVDLVKDVGIEEIFLINLIHIADDWQDRQKVFTCSKSPAHVFHSGTEEDYEEIFRETETKAKKLSIKLKRPFLSPDDIPVCGENPLKNIYISVGGEVSPCVYLYPPTDSPFKRIFCGDMHEVEKVSFGNIFKEPFHDIWNNKRYTEFRNKFFLRRKRLEEIYSLYIIDAEVLKRFETMTLPDPPEHCRTCHKMLGV